MPNLYILAGPNGAGKTTAAKSVLAEELGCYEFVNADAIAAGLSPFRPEDAAMAAGRLMLERMATLLVARADFAFESTLATRSYVPFIKRAQSDGYSVRLVYFWLSSPEQAQARVAQRVLEGGHNIAADVIERRYYRGLHNLFNLYLPLVDEWQVYDNTTGIPNLIHSKYIGQQGVIFNEDVWFQIKQQGKHPHDTA